MSEQRNVILAVVLSIAILLGYQFFFMKPSPNPVVPPTSPAASDSAVPAAPAAPGTAESTAPVEPRHSREEVIRNNFV